MSKAKNKRDDAVFCRMSKAAKKEIQEAADAESRGIGEYCMWASLDRALGNEEVRGRELIQRYTDFIRTILEENPEMSAKTVIAYCYNVFMSDRRIKDLQDRMRWEQLLAWRRGNE